MAEAELEISKVWINPAPNQSPTSPWHRICATAQQKGPPTRTKITPFAWQWLCASDNPTAKPFHCTTSYNRVFWYFCSCLSSLSLSQWNLKLCDREEDIAKICVIRTPRRTQPSGLDNFFHGLYLYFAVGCLESDVCAFCLLLGISPILKTDSSVS